MAGPRKGTFMAEPRSSAGSATTPSSSSCPSSSSSLEEKDLGLQLGGGRLPAPSAPGPSPSLVQPSRKKHGKGHRMFRLFRSVFRTFPVYTPKCSKLSTPPMCLPESHIKGMSGTRVTGTLFGYRKGRVSLSLQENPKCLPSLIVELAIQTHVLLREMSSGMVRIALECEKRHDGGGGSRGKYSKGARGRHLLDEALWTMFCNGKKSGYGVKREASEDDIRTMELLRAVSMGAGVLPGKSDVEGPDGEVAYMRANFEHVVGSKDSETLYMISPEGNNGPDLTIFFVRI